MRSAQALLLLACPFAFAAEPGVSTAARGDVRSILERKGTFLPVDAAEIVLWPEAYRGEYLVLEVLAHGTTVKEGDVVARLDDRAYAEQMRRGEFDLAQSEQRLRGQEEDARIQAEAAAAALERADRDAARAKKRLQGFLEIEQPQARERDRLNDLSWQDRIDDQNDELTELKKMYDADQLVDATEQIVLKRSERGLARTRAGFDLQIRTREYGRQYDEAFRQEDLELDARHKADALDRQKRSQAIQDARRDGELAKARLDLDLQREATARLRRDAGLFVLRAPRAGVVLHGAPQDAPWTARVERGGRLQAYRTSFTVGDPGKLEATADVGEPDLLRVPEGAATAIRPAAVPDLELPGAARIAWLPASRGGDGANLYECTVALEKVDPRLRPGMRCTIRMTLAEARDAVVIPLSSVTEKDGRKVVRCAASSAGPFEERPVELGIDDGKRVAVVSGVQAGEFVQVPEAGAK